MRAFDESCAHNKELLPTPEKVVREKAVFDIVIFLSSS
jgi:hypothetical protein